MRSGQVARRGSGAWHNDVLAREVLGHAPPKKKKYFKWCNLVYIFIFFLLRNNSKDVNFLYKIMHKNNDNVVEPLLGSPEKN